MTDHPNAPRPRGSQARERRLGIKPNRTKLLREHRIIFTDLNHDSREAKLGLLRLGGEDYDINIADSSDAVLGVKYRSFPLREVIEAYKALSNRDLQASRSHNLEALFADSSITRTIDIDRNPFDTNFSIWYLLVDLIQWKRFFSNPQHTVLMRDSRGKREYARYLKQHPEATAKQFADVHLGVRFGLLPFIKDLIDTVHVIQTWKQRYDYDEVSELFDHVLRWHKADELQNRFEFLKGWKETVVVPLNRPGFSGLATVKCSATTTVRWHGLANYRFTCPELSGFLARFAQIIDAFGILDPSAAWDVIPFSFIVDWFYTTNASAHSLKPTLFPAGVNIIDYLESISADTTLRYNLTYLEPGLNADAPSVALTSHDVGYERYRSYVRRRFRPSPKHVRIVSATPQPKFTTQRSASSAVQLQRVSISASLIAQRLPR
jgi:hypothetical protein